ncbi:MAG TPA: CotH kinase family protein [Ohtaekwangia sp.]|nr:CotH kinase family protein [Ohtaekwangia sp.]
MRIRIPVILILICFWVTLKAQDVDHWETVVYGNETWKYFPGVSDPGADWFSLDYNDNHWQSGSGGFGYGDNDDGTTLSPVLSVFLRKRFNITNVADIERIMLHVDYDDGFIAYLNGAEIARSNMGTQTIVPFDQPSSGFHEAVLYQGGVPEGFSVSEEMLQNLLKPGQNVLAVQVHNENINSSDLSAAAYLSAGMNITSATYGMVPSWFSLPFEFTSSDLPIIVINTNGQQIIDDPDIVADMGIIDNGLLRNHLTDPFNNYNGKISIEIRGESSQMFPKKSYRVETQDASGNNLNAPLLGMPSENDWVLYAPYSDKTMIRNVLTYKMGRDMGRYAPRTRYAELVINGKYEGVYVLIERIKRDKNRVDIATLNPDEISGDDLTGGYLLRVDKIDANDYPAWTSVPVPRVPHTNLINFQFVDPEGEELAKIQQDYIKQFIFDFESTLSKSDYKTTRQYLQYIDASSFIDFMIVSEIGKNVDAYIFSTYLYKDKDSNDKRLHMGPLWDFNLAYGNVDYQNNSQFAPGWTYNDEYRMYWFVRLMRDPVFYNQFVCRWRTLRETTLTNDYFTEAIDSISTALTEARHRNYERWKILGTYIWPNQYVGATYEDEISFLKNWIQDRLSWMDNNLPATCAVITDVNPDVEKYNFTVFPNPSNIGVTMRSSRALPPGVEILIHNSLGVLVYRSPFHEELKWDGTHMSGEKPAAGLYHITLMGGTKRLNQQKVIFR